METVWAYMLSAPVFIWGTSLVSSQFAFASMSFISIPSCCSPAACAMAQFDDPAGAFAIHGLSGVWGVMFVGLLANGEYVDQVSGVGVRGCVLLAWCPSFSPAAAVMYLLQI